MTVRKLRTRPHSGQRIVHDDPARFKVLAAGRRWGKTRLGVSECLDYASQGKRAWWVAPSYKMGAVGWRPLARMGGKLGADVRKGDRQVLLPGCGEVSVRSADDPQSLRGEGLDYVVIDECALIQEDAWTEALRPALSDRLGKALFISTPAGRNWFWRLWMRGQDMTQGEWRSWRFPTSGNPYIAASEIEAAHDLLPEQTFKQEYLAEFLESEGAVFRNIRPCLHSEPTVPGQHRAHRVVAGVDWAQQNDFTSISVVCADCALELALDRFNQIDYTFQRGRLKALVDKWRVTDVLAEANAMGTPIIDTLQREGLPVRAFMTTASSKPPLIESLALAFERAEVRWLADDVATLELEAYERQVNAKTSRASYGAPEGLHDDTVIARALANHARLAGLSRAYVY